MKKVDRKYMNHDLLNEFLLESFENLATISEEITSLEKKSRDPELLNSIFRKIHTLKGSAGFLGFKRLQTVAHAAESLLDLMRENVIPANAKVCDCLLEAVDASNEILKNIEANQAEPLKDYAQVIEKIHSQINKTSHSPEEKILLTGLKVPKLLFDVEIQAPAEVKKMFWHWPLLKQEKK